MSLARIIQLDPQKPNQNHLKEASDTIRNGGLVIIPTETVYGIAANALDQKAVDRLCAIKERAKDKPFAFLIHDRGKIEEFARNIPIAAYKLIDKFWPGPLTIILKAKPRSTLMAPAAFGIKGESVQTVGLRMPDYKIALKIIELSAVPVVCPSANLSGKVAPVDFLSAIKDLQQLVDLAVDSGHTALGIESSIVDLATEPYSVVREQAISKEQINEIASKKNILFVCTGNSCRSVMAEALLKKKLKEKNRNDVEVMSAGIIMLGGLGPTEGTREALKEEGIDISVHRSQKLTKEMVKKSDLIIAMEQMHEERILQLAPEVKNRVFLLKEFAKISDDNLNVADPLGKPLQFYEQTMAVIKEAIERMVDII